MARISTCLLSLGLCLSFACSSEPERTVEDEFEAEACERQDGDSCDECDEGEVGTYACVDDELRCPCEPESATVADDEEDEPKSPRAPSTPSMSDAGKALIDAAVPSNAPKADAATPQKDAGSAGDNSIEAPSSGDPTRPDPSKLPKRHSEDVPDVLQSAVTISGASLSRPERERRALHRILRPARPRADLVRGPCIRANTARLRAPES